MKNKIVQYSAILCCVLGGFSCQDQYWDQHYQAESSESTLSLMEVMQSRPELSEFCKLVKELGYDTLFNSSQTFTVWAPNNDAMQGYRKNENSKYEFLQNHIAHYIFNTTDLSREPQLRVKMLNGKYQTFNPEQGGYQFAGVNMQAQSFPAANGLLHIIGDRAPFLPNLWELMSQTGITDSIAEYLTSYDELIFLPSASIAIGSNELGQIVYDSVFYNNNLWLRRYGYLNLEDSVYTFLMPTNMAYDEAKTRIAPYYKSYGKMLSETGTGTTLRRTFETSGAIADSLQKTFSSQTLAKDLVFRGKWDNIPPDSLISTSGNVFHSPGYLFENAVKTPVSNGLAYITNELKHSPLSSWHQEIRVEAENPAGRLFDYASLSNLSTLETAYADSVSESRFLEVRNTGTSSITQPWASFEIPRTLSAKYNIYCVFAPSIAFDAYAKADSTKVQFFLNYVHVNGIMNEDAAISKDPVTGLDFITNPRRMTKCLIAKNFVFPYSNVASDQVVTVRVRVRTNVATNETTRFSKYMRIDCIILEPVND